MTTMPHSLLEAALEGSVATPAMEAGRKAAGVPGTVAAAARVFGSALRIPAATLGGHAICGWPPRTLFECLCGFYIVI